MTETKMMDPKVVRAYNRTQLFVEHEFERHVFHRDRFAHYLRWSYVLRMVKPGSGAIMDVGCGDANLLKTLYVNRRAPALYLGIDVKSKKLGTMREQWAGKKTDVEFRAHDAVVHPLPASPKSISPEWAGGDHWDFITSFEVCEHIGKANVPIFLDNIKNAMGPDTIAMISTPCYDAKVGAADNHMINGEVGELTYDEMYDLVSSRFTIEQSYGTFASKRDIMPKLDAWETSLVHAYEELEKYWDPNVMSVLFAPLFPEASRNVMWQLRAKS